MRAHGEDGSPLELSVLEEATQNDSPLEVAECRLDPRPGRVRVTHRVFRQQTSFWVLTNRLWVLNIL